MMGTPYYLQVLYIGFGSDLDNPVKSKEQIVESWKYRKRQKKGMVRRAPS